MADARETVLSALAPVAPTFTRKLVPGRATLEKFAGVDSEFEDITRGPTRAAGAGVAIAMDVPVVPRKARIDLTNALVTLTAANDYGSLKLVDLPDRNILILNAEFTGTVLWGGDFADNDDPVIGIGTTAASASPVASTMVNVIAATTFTNIVVATANDIALTFVGATGSITGLLVADAAGNALYLNVSAPDTQLATDGTATFNGYVDLVYLDLGNRSS